MMEGIEYEEAKLVAGTIVICLAIIVVIVLACA
jgi:hypothetical protein